MPTAGSLTALDPLSGRRRGPRQPQGHPRFTYSLRALRWYERFLNGDAEELPAVHVDYPSVVSAGAQMGRN